jgi:hypothetical protein
MAAIEWWPIEGPSGTSVGAGLLEEVGWAILLALLLWAVRRLRRRKSGGATSRSGGEPPQGAATNLVYHGEVPLAESLLVDRRRVRRPPRPTSRPGGIQALCGKSSQHLPRPARLGRGAERGGRDGNDPLHAAWRGQGRRALVPADCKTRSVCGDLCRPLFGWHARRAPGKVGHGRSAGAARAAVAQCLESCA